MSLDDALRILDKLPGCNQEAWAVRANILIRKGELDEAEKMNEMTLFGHVRDAQMVLLSLANIAEKQQNLPRAFAMLDTVEHLGEWFGLQAERAGTSRVAATRHIELLCRQQKWQEALERIEQYAEDILHPVKSNTEEYFAELEWKTLSQEFVLKNQIELLEVCKLPPEITENDRYQKVYQALCQKIKQSQEK